MKENSIYRTLFQNATIGIIVSDKEGEIVQSNSFANRLFDYEEGELIGQKIEVLVPMSYRSKHIQHRSHYHQKPVKREMGSGLDLYGRRKDGFTFPVAISLGSFMEEGEPMIIAYINDATKQKEYEQQIQQEKELAQNSEALLKKSQLALEDYAATLEARVKERTAKLEESQQQLIAALSKEKELGELKSRFVSMASHEFRTPLSMILSSAELLEMYHAKQDYRRFDRNINRIKSSVSNLVAILQDFLSLEKLEANKVEVNKKTLNLSTFLEELQEGIQPILKESQQLLIQKKNIDSLETDAFLLKNILLNLISNAIKYSPNGEDIQLTISRHNDQVVFAVIDQGMGIPQSEQVHLFQRFFRASNAENIQGTGLGLTIVQRYVKLLDGRLEFESSEGEGSRFSVFL